MKPRSAMRLDRWIPVAAMAAVLFAVTATEAATYQWRDGQGRMVYSDLPPPPSTPPKHIIAGPQARTPLDQRGMAQVSGAEPNAAKAGDAAVRNGPDQGNGPVKADKAGIAIPPGQVSADRELAFRKRQAEQAEQEKQVAEASRRRSEVAKACADFRGDIRALESGRRIARIGAGGEQEFVSDAERSDRLKDARKNVGEHC